MALHDKDRFKITRTQPNRPKIVSPRSLLIQSVNEDESSGIANAARAKIIIGRHAVPRLYRPSRIEQAIPINR
jgi:hypothetical protein